MKEITNFINKIIFLIITLICFEAQSKIVSLGDINAKVKVKVFSSLTCPACANFHSEIFYKLKNDYIDKGLIIFEHHPFPLDLAALNAEIILRCDVDKSRRFELLGKLYEKQSVWAVGSDIDKINDSIKKIALEINLESKKISDCLKNEKNQDEILNQRINAQKNYNIDATPTIFINEKKYEGKVDYKKIKKIIDKSL